MLRILPDQATPSTNPIQEKIMLPKYVVCLSAALVLIFVSHPLVGMTNAEKAKIRNAIKSGNIDKVITLVQDKNFNPPDFSDPTCDAMLLFTTIIHDSIPLAEALSKKDSLQVSVGDIEEILKDDKKQPNRFAIARSLAAKAKKNDEEKIKNLIIAEEKEAGVPHVPIAGEKKDQPKADSTKQLFDVFKTETKDDAIVAKIGALLEKEPELVNAVSDYLNTPLYWATAQGHTKSVQLLLTKGADVNVKNMRGETPLHNAAQIGNQTIAEALINKGANVNAITNFGKTPLDWATLNKHEKIVEMLLANGAKVNAMAHQTLCLLRLRLLALAKQVRG